MTIEDALRQVRGMSVWLATQIQKGKVCECGMCLLCAYREIEARLKGQEEAEKLAGAAKKMVEVWHNPVGGIWFEKIGVVVAELEGAISGYEAAKSRNEK